MRLALDENISPKVAVQVRTKRSEIDIVSLYEWRGALTGSSDDVIISALNEEERLLVTFDTQILSELRHLFDSETPFTGILFIDEKTITPADIGRLTNALIAFVDNHITESWYRRIAFLTYGSP